MTQDFIKPNEETRIQQGSQVSLHFKVSLENGDVIDSTFERPEPVSLVIGDGNLLEGFEKVLNGLRAGDKRTAVLSPTEAFGEWNPENIQHFGKNKFVLSGQAPIPGAMIEFEDKGKNTLAGVVKEVTADTVVVDFNHPLAGQTINFHIEVFKVTPLGSQGVKFS